MQFAVIAIMRQWYHQWRLCLSCFQFLMQYKMLNEDLVHDMWHLVEKLFKYRMDTTEEIHTSDMLEYFDHPSARLIVFEMLKKGYINSKELLTSELEFDDEEMQHIKIAMLHEYEDAYENANFSATNALSKELQSRFQIETYIARSPRTDGTYVFSAPFMQGQHDQNNSVTSYKFFDSGTVTCKKGTALLNGSYFIHDDRLEWSFDETVQMEDESTILVQLQNTPMPKAFRFKPTRKILLRIWERMFIAIPAAFCNTRFEF